MLLAPTTLIYRYGEIVRKLPLVSGTRSYIVSTEVAECVGIIGRGEKIRTSGPCLPKAVLYQAELHPEPRAIIHLHTIVRKKNRALCEL